MPALLTDHSPLPPALFLLGPTATGKTDLALSLLNRFDAEIVSVDSALVYRDMNIGTAKPDAVTLTRYRHHVIDLIDPDQAFSAAAFCEAALVAMADITARGKLPVLVGGTMLYANALREGLSKLPIANPETRNAIAARAATAGWPALHAELAKIDPVTAQRLQPNDSQRIQRALEVWEMTGTPISALQQRAKTVPLANHFPYRAVAIGLDASDRAALHARIATRFTAMLDAGLLDEVIELRKRYQLEREMPSMRAVGYRQAWQFLDGEIDYKTLHDTAVAATRQLAKRQLTWLRSMPWVTRMDFLDEHIAEKIIARINALLHDQPGDTTAHSP